MLPARAAAGLLVAGVAAVGTVALAQGGADPPQGDRGCVDGESAYTSDSLHDVRSFSDAMAIVRAVRETVPPAPEGPEGWAGLIGRRVTMRVERVLWRRPHAPRPPAGARFNDLGWFGEVDDRRPMMVCGETRMVVGRRYLAPIVRHNGQWYPFFTVRLALDGDRVVGGVDAGEPNNAHHALAGRRVKGAVRLVARTKPYRAVVLEPKGSPARRWQRVDADDYRVWRQRPGAEQVVASGVTDRSRWQLYVRLPARGGLCMGITARALWHPIPSPSGEGCGSREVRPERITLSIFFARHRGAFVFGRAGSRVWAVRTRFGDGGWRRADTRPSPRRVGGRFWVVPVQDEPCSELTVEGLGRGDRVLSRDRVRYAAC
jgi:hypothetical protein